MPQNGRSVAFSNKQKKEQLKAKKERKKFVSTSEGERKSFVPSLDRKDKFNNLLPQCKSNLFQEVEEINFMSHSSRKSRYNLKFRKEAKPKLLNHQHEAIKTVPMDELEKDNDSFFPVDLNYPHRPVWKKNMSKAELEQSENRSFRLFCEDLDKKYDGKELSLYELNLETWRQLWRVTEMSEILLIIVDSRFSVAQFPPYLYQYLVEEEKKGVILILNKCDLLPPSLVIAWQDYFTEKFPKLIVVPFSSMERKTLKKSTLVMAYESAKKLVDACEKLARKNVEFSLWRQKIEEERVSDDFKCQILNEHDVESTHPQLCLQKFKDGILTIGTIGHPNVGKSSVINALMGKKVVSVSKTPGHTKYFQTIFLTKNIKLCDCPGLVFPSLCPKDLQIILGSYPIAQVRNPISTVSYIASRLDLPSILKLSLQSLQPTEIIDTDFHWTPFFICEAWAIKRGYFTKTKGGRPDIHRAANELLRFTLVGYKNIILSLSPPGYSSNKGRYESDPRQLEIEKIQGVHSKNGPNAVQAGAFEAKLQTSESEESSSEDDSCNIDEETRDNAAISCDDQKEDDFLSTVNFNKFELLESDE